MSSTSHGEVIQFRIPGDTKYVSMVRRGINSIARSIDLSDNVIADIELSVSEAIANAIEHGSPEHEGNVVVVTCKLDSDKLIIDVRDEGPGFEPKLSHPCEPDVMLERGRGLHLISELMDSVQVSRMRKGSKLRMVKRVETAGREVAHAA